MRSLGLVVIGWMLSAALGGCSTSTDTPASSQIVVDAGALKMRVTQSPWNMSFVDAEGNPVLVELPDMGDGPSGSLGMHLGPPPPGSGQIPALPPIRDGEPSTPPERQSGWVHAIAVESSSDEGDTYVATLTTSDPARKLELVAVPAADGVIQITVRPTNAEGVQALGVGFAADEAERFVGFGERSNAVDQAGWALEHYPTDGPYYDAEEWSVLGDLLPPWGTRWRPDATYFPIPWLLSSRGYGVLLDNDEISYHRVGYEAADAWSMEVETAEMQFRVFAGPTPLEALGRYTEAVGRQPDEYAPWFFGTWLQTDRDDRIVEARNADVPTSLNATYTHYLPCGSQQGNEENQRVRTAATHDMGAAIHTYFNPMICVSYEPVFREAEEQGVLMQHSDGQTYVFEYCSSLTNCFEVSKFDFTSENGVSAYQALTDEALEHGYDGWMEDYGEFTALDAVSAEGITGTAYHNGSVRDYHCGAHEATADADKPLARFTRSGWTGFGGVFPDRLGW